MAQYAILLDTRFCTGCNTCFYKCVQENRLHDVAENGNTRTLVYINDTGMYHHRCMHCVDPTCVANCEKQALTKTEYGPVLWDAEACIRCQTCVEKCPFHIPMFDEANRKIVKCSMCAHRDFDQNKDAQPACVEVCPTGALEFGERQAMVDKAKKMAADFKLNIYGLEENGGTSLLILNQEDPLKVGYPEVEKKAAAEGGSSWKVVGAVAGAAAVAAVAYVGLKKYGERKDQIDRGEK